MSDAGQHADDLVRRAIAATRELPESCGPSAAILSQTSAALRQAALRPQKSILPERITHMSWVLKATAVFAIAAAILVSFVFLSSPTGHSLAFAVTSESSATAAYATIGSFAAGISCFVRGGSIR